MVFQVTKTAAGKVKGKTSKSKSEPIVKVLPEVAKEALRLARGRDVHIETVDEKTVIIKNGKR